MASDNAMKMQCENAIKERASIKRAIIRKPIPRIHRETGHTVKSRTREKGWKETKQRISAGENERERESMVQVDSWMERGWRNREINIDRVRLVWI